MMATMYFSSFPVLFFKKKNHFQSFLSLNNSDCGTSENRCAEHPVKVGWDFDTRRRRQGHTLKRNTFGRNVAEDHGFAAVDFRRF